MNLQHLLLQSLNSLLPPLTPSSSYSSSPFINLSNSSSSSSVDHLNINNLKLSRREISVAAASATLPFLLLSSDTFQSLAVCITDNGQQEIITKKAFMDISIDNKPAGRITIGLYGDAVPAGANRFAELISGSAGVSYRRKEFVKITPTYVQHEGVRSYGADVELAKRRAGNDLSSPAGSELLSEWEKCNGGEGDRVVVKKGSVGIVVRDPTKPPAKTKLVARKGKIEVVEEEVRPDPNGTEFVIATDDSPELAGMALVVGKVLDGMDVVQKVGNVEAVQDNTSSPYFRVAKLIGDKRAVVAERGFNRPYSNVVVTNCGLLD